ncbi:MAG: methionine--tRNA ligase [Candidatus Omnitrophica bacterium]|nr:methionine--tRNA ligase [Candidatus Omnitrophota bacterium]
MAASLKKNRPCYVTTPIYYVNAKPHIGHAYTTILCDTFARFYRFLGHEVYFLTGTDEHGEKIEKTAQQQGVPTIEYVDQVSERFRALWNDLGITHDDFIRTTEQRHIEVVHCVLQQLHAKGDIYLGKYKGWYCTPCETFWTQSQLEKGNCPDCKRPTQELEEDNYFFKMSKYQDWLIDYIKAHERFIVPQSKEKEVLSFLKEPLEDLCISRPIARMAWGIPLPFNADHVLYVWFDALINYISAIKYGKDNEYFNKYWPATIHFMAKDILRQHAIYWPIMLHALGLEMPEYVLAHGYWTMEGAKMSKSVGNIADPYDVIAAFNRDTLRYFLLKEVRLGLDGAYADEYVAGRFATDLANDLGNLIHRSFSMLEKYKGGVLPKAHADDTYGPIKKAALALGPAISEAMVEKLDPREALTVLWEFIGMINKLIEDTKPWTLAKDPAHAAALEDFLYVLFESLRFIAVTLVPFMPDTAEKILELLQQETTCTIDEIRTWGGLKAGIKLEKGDPLFPKLEEKK